VDQLFEPERHEPLSERRWDATWAQETLVAIVRQAEAAFDARSWWPVHASDAEGISGHQNFKSLYFGATGVIWALHHLARAGAVSLARDYSAFMPAIYQAYGEQPDLGKTAPSYFLGEVGIALVMRRLTGDVSLDDRLYERIRENIHEPSLELCWGAPGTMMAAEAMYLWTGEARWKTLFLQNAEYLVSLWREEPEYGCRLWTQDMYGFQVKHVGSGHGFAGNVLAMLRRADWLPDNMRQTLYRECTRTFSATARVAGEYANWPQSVGVPRPGRTAMLVQWCHGAPGMVTALGTLPCGLDSGADELLVRAGELTWRAGPLSKGFGLCHGTAGNGYAFLRLHERTGDTVWLERACAFAVHAVEQMQRMRAESNMGRYSLWTGDIGLALYLWDCLHQQAAIPTLDVL
jgi:lantibiotic modifying enzyme